MHVELTIEREFGEDTVSCEVEVEVGYTPASPRGWEDPGDDEVWEVLDVRPWGCVAVELTAEEEEEAFRLAREKYACPDA
jgi:hypothetical protein